MSENPSRATVYRMPIGDVGSGGEEGMVEEEDHDVGCVERIDGDLRLPDPAAMGDPHSLVITSHVGSGGGNQLTLSFQGEVYVFDSVSPEKVQAVLLLLGGWEITAPGVSTVPSSSSQHHNKRTNFPHRVASLMRFREKRKERNFDKKIRYTPFAKRMQRNKGQFTSSKSKLEDATVGVATWEASQHWGEVDGRPLAAPAVKLKDLSKNPSPLTHNGLSEPKDANGPV